MKSFFDPCVDRIIELIKFQNDQVGKTGNRVKVAGVQSPSRSYCAVNSYAEHVSHRRLCRVQVPR